MLNHLILKTLWGRVDLLVHITGKWLSERVSNFLKFTQLLGNMAESKPQDESLTFSDWPVLPFISSCPSEDRCWLNSVGGGGRTVKFPCSTLAGKEAFLYAKSYITSLTRPMQELL